ncbi:MAG: hypothetical protein HY934_07370 [Candidatus Firestonebacteria bacterium]|nr:hypothetical protein [Candidatus Firestonebacteria bacterium]
MNISKKILFIFFTIFIIYFNYLIAKEKDMASAPIFVESSVDKADITIGDIIKYSLIINYDTSIKVEMPPVGINLAEFEIKDYKILDPEKYDTRAILRNEYLITTFTTGDYVIPPVIIKYLEKGKGYKELSSQKIFIRVHKTPVRQQDKDDIRGLKNVTELKVSYVYYLAIFLLVLIITGGIAGYLFFRKKCNIKETVKEQKPLRPAHEIALEELQKLRNGDLLSTGKIKQYFIILSLILRKYIEGRYKIMALDRTTEEIISELKILRIKWDEINIFKEILESSDLVKFAKLIPEQKKSERILEVSEEIVNKTIKVNG